MKSKVLLVLLMTSINLWAMASSGNEKSGGTTGTAVDADRLTGLWRAQRWFGPAARGTLIIQRKVSTYTADMMGRIMPVRSHNNELSFDLPGDEGSFRGKIQKGSSIQGHWFPPSSHALLVGFRFASPVTLTPDGPERWKGTVTPFEDSFTFYLLVKKQTDGSFAAILNNPDRNYGAQIGVQKIAMDGNIVKLLGKRQSQKDEQELARGMYDSANDIMTLSFPDRGGTYDFSRDGDESNFYPRGKNSGQYLYHPPLARDNGWPTATLTDVDITQAGIERFIQMIVDMPMDTLNVPQVHGILIARHGKLVLEEYFHGENRDKLHDTRSAAKSLTATIVGAVMQAGAPLKLSTPVYKLMNGGKFPDGLNSIKRAMTLENLLTMLSGYFCDDNNDDAPGNENTMLEQTVEPDYYQFTLRLPMAYPPGEKSIYCSINPNLALGMVSRVTGESPMYTFDRLIAAPLKISRYAWVLDPAGHPYGGGSVQLLPRDFMKLGQLMLSDGVWKGRRILSHDFVSRACSPLYNLNNIQYGYLWWSMDFPYKNRTVRAFFAGGNGGQSVTVIPDLDLVIATYAGNYSTRVGIHIQQDYIPNYILPAVREAGDDKNLPVIEGHFVTPYGHSDNNGRIVKNK